MKSFPMLGTRFAEAIIHKAVAEGKSVEDLAKDSGTSHPKARLSETGLRCADDSELQALRDDILVIARKHGYPHRWAEKSGSFSEFDREATHVLVKHVDAPVNDARSTELWNFITTVLLLDVASWRFPNKGGNPRFNRYLGASPKSTFKKLWWRGHVLGKLSDRIGEDQSVALLERTSVSGDPRLPKAIIREFTGRSTESDSSTRLSDQFRSTMLITKARLATICIEALDDEQVDQFVQDCVDAALAR